MDKVDIICSIFNIREIPVHSPQIGKITDPLSFVKREKYTEEVNESLLQFFIEFIKEVIGERNEASSESSNQRFRKHIGNYKR